MCHPCHPCMRTCGWCLELSVFFLVSFVFYLVSPFSFQPFLMSTSALNERSMSNPLCYSSLGSVVTSDYVTPLTQWANYSRRNPKRSAKYVYHIGTLASSIARAGTSFVKEERSESEIHQTHDGPPFHSRLRHQERTTSRTSIW